MGKILYYSNYCNNCKNLLSIISRTELVKTIHFVCIDKRTQKNGKNICCIRIKSRGCITRHY